MPSLSQTFGVGGAGSSAERLHKDYYSKDHRPALSPIQKSSKRKPTSPLGVEFPERRVRNHLRSQSDSSVPANRWGAGLASVRPSTEGSSNSSSSSSSRKSVGNRSPPFHSFSTRTSHYHRNCVGSGHGKPCPADDRRETYQDKLERCRQTYQATSIERELETLNAAIRSVQKWLKKKHQALQSLQQGPLSTSPAPGTPKSPRTPKRPPQLQRKNVSNRCETSIQTREQNSKETATALLKKLVTEAGHQQEAVDVLLDRGRRYLGQRACVTLQEDLDNLAFLWAAYTKKLHVLRDRLGSDDDDGNNSCHPDLPDQGELVVEEQHDTHASSSSSSGHSGRRDRPEGKGRFNDGRDESLEGGKENDDRPGVQRCLPVKGRRTVARGRTSSSVSDVCRPPLATRIEKADRRHISLEVSPKGKSGPGSLEKTKFPAEEKQQESPFVRRLTAVKSPQEKKKAALAQPLVKSSPSGVLYVKKPRGGPEVNQEGNNTRNLHKTARDPTSTSLRKPPSILTPVPTRRKFATTPERVKSERIAKVEPTVRSSPNITNLKKRESCCEEKECTDVAREANPATLPSETSSPENRCLSNEKGSACSPEGKSVSPSTVIALSPWPSQSGNGWLKVAGAGAFTSPPSRRSEHFRRSPFSSSDPLQTSFSFSREISRSEDSTTGSQSAGSGPPVREESRVNHSSTASSVVTLGKRIKENHDEKLQLHAEGEAHCAAGVAGHGDLTGLNVRPGLRASEEDIHMEIEATLKEIHAGTPLAAAASPPTMDTGLKNASRKSPSRNTSARTSPSPSPAKDSLADNTISRSLSKEHLCLEEELDLDSPTGPKRRRMNSDTLGSCSGSPYVSGDSSLNATPTDSPAGTLRKGELKLRYKKDELWRAIESNYKYLMDKEIIDTCQSTGSALAGGEEEKEEAEEDLAHVTFAEFVKQYQELVDWLTLTQRSAQRDASSLSEKYLNQTCHDEMLEKAPRRDLLYKYAAQLLHRYPSPSLRDQVTLRLQRLTNLWQAVEATIGPYRSQLDTQVMLQDLECDLQALRRWLNATESRLLPLTIRADWTDEELERRLKQHQELQHDIESHSRIVSAVLKLSERLDKVGSRSGSGAGPGWRGPSCGRQEEEEAEALQLAALGLERRWHGIWLQSLEWQCRLEEAINRRKGLYGSGFNFSSFTLPAVDECCYGNDGPGGQDSSNSSLIELSDDSLLFIGARCEHRLAESPDLGESLTSLDVRGSPVFSAPSPRLTNFLDRSSGDSANISECESRMGDSPPGGGDQDMLSHGGRGNNSYLCSDGEGEERGRPSLAKACNEPKDIGYSSESQSNDEGDHIQQQIALECRFAGIVEVASDSPLGDKMAIPPAGGVMPNYYCMTLVELDSTDKTTTTDDDNTTDDKENRPLVAKKALSLEENNCRQNGVSIVNGIKEFGCRNCNGDVGDKAVFASGLLDRNSSSEVSDREVASSTRGSHEDIYVKSWMEPSSDEMDGANLGGLPMFEDLPLFSAFLPGSESDSATESHDKIRYLIEHAEELVKSPLPRSSPSPGSPKRRVSPSKQTQTTTTETSNVESSCDASSENSEDSGTEEFSTATDDAEETLFNSVINLESASLDFAAQEDLLSFVATSDAGLDHARLRKQTGPRSGQGNRPWSVVGLQDSHKADFQPLSTSESATAADHHQRPHSDTDSSSSNVARHAATFPHRGKVRPCQRTRSLCETSATSSRAAAKRKLKYTSSSSSATDSQMSKSSGTKMALSTEDEDDKTLLFDSTEQSRSYDYPAKLAESESETSDEYVTASLDELMTSADEDPHNSSSFSENAWDNYQMMYPTASEDATEEVLHWEPVEEMEFDDDFSLNHSVGGSSLVSEAIKKRASKLKPQHTPGGGLCDDSDSDMEDFRSVLDDSEKCLKVVDHSLKKKRSNPMGTGLAHQSKYAEILATCKTNIECVTNVCSHLTEEDVCHEDVLRVQEMLPRWEELRTLASNRHQQAEQLRRVGETFGRLRQTLKSAEQSLLLCHFASTDDLRANISTLKLKGNDLTKQKEQILELEKVINAFLQVHPSVNVSKYVQELQALGTATTQALEKVSKRLQSLENNFLVWCEYLNGEEELKLSMEVDSEHVLALLCQKEAGQFVSRRAVLQQLEKLKGYKDKLAVQQALRRRLMDVSDDQAQQMQLARMADQRNQLEVISQQYRELFLSGDEEDDAQGLMRYREGLGRLAVAAASLGESYIAANNLSQQRHYADSLAAMEAAETASMTPASHSTWSWLRSVPAQIVALMMVAGLIYVLDPDILSGLSSFSLTITPDLRHVNGPPPS